MVKARSVCFTINNPSTDDEVAVQSLATECAYIVCGREIAPQTGTPHLQGYAHFSSGRSLKALSKKLKRAHIEPARGTAQQNLEYCTKTGEIFLQHGKVPMQGERNDIDECRDIARTSGHLREVVCKARSVQGLRIAEVYLKYHEPPRTWKTTVRWYWGPTGYGKSFHAREWLESECPGDVYTALEHGKFWEGYDGHRGVIIDDYRRDFCKFHVLLQLLDRYAYRVETKGSSRQMLATHLAITSPLPPHATWAGRSDEDIGQLTRRIDEVIMVSGVAPRPRGVGMDE